MDPIVDYRARTASQITMSRYMSGVYGWMTFGLLITGVVSYVIAASPAMLSLVMSPVGMVLGFGLPLGLVFAMSFGINRMSVAMATMCFLLFAFAEALLFSTIFLRYSIDTIGEVFMITASSFAVLAVYGTTTKRDLTGLGTFLMMAVWGLVISMVVNMFLRSSMVDFGLCAAGVLIFAGLTTYDSQKIRQFAARGDFTSDAAHKFAIIAALQLYLDFINLFLMLLRLVGGGGGRRRD
jgi:uncharacterized protein